MNLRVSVYVATAAAASQVQAAALLLLGEPLMLTPQQAYDRDGPIGPVNGYLADVVLGAAQIQALISAAEVLVNLPMVWNARLDAPGAAATDFASFWTAAQTQSPGFLESIGTIPPEILAWASNTYGGNPSP